MEQSPLPKAAGWYPGHMLKAQHAMRQALSLVDLAVELVDARAPLATRNPRLARLIANKSSAKFKKEALDRLVKGLSEVVEKAL